MGLSADGAILGGNSAGRPDVNQVGCGPSSERALIENRRASTGAEHLPRATVAVVHGECRHVELRARSSGRGDLLSPKLTVDCLNPEPLDAAQRLVRGDEIVRPHRALAERGDMAFVHRAELLVQ
jgi:hypothetical protein